MADAFVLAGAVAKGAFGAGVIGALTEPATARAIGLDVRRVVGASSGALNAAWLAHSVHAGSLEGCGAALERLWIDQATFTRVFDVDLRALIGRSGVFGESKVIDILRGAIAPADAKRPIDLRVVVTNLAGDPRRVGGHPETTFEHVMRFDGHAFTAADRLEHLFRVVAASAAFPIVFSPVTLRIGGRDVPSIDGGAVNNAPLFHAIEGSTEIDRVFVVSPFPRVFAGPAPVHGLAYASHLADVLIEERMFRDLRDADHQNRALARLDELGLEAHVHRAVLGAIGWTGRRRITIVEVRPERALEADAFRGFLSRRLREDYVKAGRGAALAAIERAPRSG